MISTAHILNSYLLHWHKHISHRNLTSLWRSSFLFLLSILARSRSVNKGPSTTSTFFFGASPSSIPSSILTGAARLRTVGLALTNPCLPNFSDIILQTYPKKQTSRTIQTQIERAFFTESK